MRKVLSDYASAGRDLLLGDFGQARASLSNAELRAKEAATTLPQQTLAPLVRDASDLGLSMLQQSAGLTNGLGRANRNARVMMMELEVLLCRAGEAYRDGHPTQAWLYYEVVSRTADEVLDRYAEVAPPVSEAAAWLRDQTEAGLGALENGRGPAHAEPAFDAPGMSVILKRAAEDMSVQLRRQLETNAPAVKPIVPRTMIDWGTLWPSEKGSTPSSSRTNITAGLAEVTAIPVRIGSPRRAVTPSNSARVSLEEGGIATGVIDKAVSRAFAAALTSIVARIVTPTNAATVAAVSDDGVVMGVAGTAPVVDRHASLDLFLELLRLHPEADRDGSIVTRALALWSEVGDNAERESRLMATLSEPNPGWVGVFLYQLAMLRRQDDVALELMARLLDQPERHFPKGTSSLSSVQDSLPGLLRTSRFDAALQALLVIEPYKPAGIDRLWMQFAETCRAANKAELYQQALKHSRQHQPGPQRAAAARQTPGADESEDTITNLQARARISPAENLTLGDALYRAGRFAEARESYGLYARRFNSAYADMRRIETFRAEGDIATWMKERREHVVRYPNHDLGEVVVELAEAELGIGSSPPDMVRQLKQDGAVTSASTVADRVAQAVLTVRDRINPSEITVATLPNVTTSSEHESGDSSARLPLLPGHREFAFYEDFATPSAAWDFAPQWCLQPQTATTAASRTVPSFVITGVWHGGDSHSSASLNLARPGVLGRRLTIGGAESVAVYFSVLDGSEGTIGIGFHNDVATNAARYFVEHRDAARQCWNLGGFLRWDGKMGRWALGARQEKSSPLDKPRDGAVVSSSSTETRLKGAADFALCFTAMPGGGSAVTAYQRVPGMGDWSRMGPPAQTGMVLVSPQLWICVKSGTFRIGGVGISIAAVVK